MSADLVYLRSVILYHTYPTFMSIGYIGHVFNILVFSRQRQNACSIFLLSSAVINILYLSFNGFTQVFPFYYANETVGQYFLCKIRLYFGNFLGQLARILFILAVFDRFMFINKNSNFRAFITPKRAKWFVLAATVFWAIFASHIFFVATIVNGRCSTTGIYFTIYSVYLTLFVGFIPSFSVAMLSYLTFRQVIQSRARIGATVSNTNRMNENIRRRDRKFLIIVMSESAVFFLTTIPYSLVSLETLISNNTLTNKSIQYSRIESFVMEMTLLLLYVNNAIPFYINAITSKSFRYDVKQLFIDLYRKLSCR